MKFVYAPGYHINIGAHVYPTLKYPQIHAALLARGAAPDGFVEPSPVSWDDLALVHTREYLDKAATGQFTLEELAELELPWSHEIVEGFRLMTGGTILAARLALAARDTASQQQSGPTAAAGFAVAANIGGGFHHAFANHGEGFCLFNDVAVAIRLLQRDASVSRAAVIDCDVHHGNGTAFLFERDSSVFTFSMHQQHNYPLFKPRGSLDIGLPDRTGDRQYLSALEGALPAVAESRPEIVFYLAGADPFRDDQLGGLALTFDGLRARDALVFRWAREARVPVVVTLAGGYARRMADTVAIHVATIEEAMSATA